MEILLTLPGTEPIPCCRYRQGLFSVCLDSGNQQMSCYRSREKSSVTVPKKTTTPSLDADLFFDQKSKKGILVKHLNLGVTPFRVLKLT